MNNVKTVYPPQSLRGGGGGGEFWGAGEQGHIRHILQSNKRTKIEGNDVSDGEHV